MLHHLNPLIRKLEAVASLSFAEKEAILNLPTTVRVIKAQRDIVRERDKASQCCLVIDGWLYRYKILENGSRQIISFHVNGDLPDLQSLHLKTMDHNLGSIVKSTVAFIQHEAVNALSAEFPNIRDVLWRDTLVDAAIFRECITGIGSRQAPERMAHLFCELFTRMQAVGLTQKNICPMPISQQALADALGLSTVHVNRSLMHLRRRGLIQLEKQVLTILDWGRLKAESGFDSQYLHLHPARLVAA